MELMELMGEGSMSEFNEGTAERGVLLLVTRQTHGAAMVMMTTGESWGCWDEVDFVAEKMLKLGPRRKLCCGFGEHATRQRPPSSEHPHRNSMIEAGVSHEYPPPQHVLRNYHSYPYPYPIFIQSSSQCTSVIIISNNNNLYAIPILHRSIAAL